MPRIHTDLHRSLIRVYPCASVAAFIPLASRIGAAGAPGGGLVTILERREAIAAAVATARDGDVVLIAGKGHETTQTTGDSVLPFDDREVARVALGARR